MTEDPPSSARLRRIGRALRQLREQSGYTLKAAGRRLERSASSLSLIENGTQALRRRDLKYILDVYEAAPPLHQALMTLAEQEQQGGWWDDFRDIASRSDLDYASLESDATRLNTLETRFIPGLLQTEDYAQAVVRSDPREHDTSKIDRYVEFRLGRQQILHRSNPPALHVIIDEAALRRQWGGPEVMREQLSSLLDRSYSDHITLQLLPFAGIADARVSNTFLLLDVGQPAIISVVLVDHLNGRWILETEEDLTRYREAFTQVSDAALNESNTRLMIHRIISEL